MAQDWPSLKSEGSIMVGKRKGPGRPPVLDRIFNVNELLVGIDSLLTVIEHYDRLVRFNRRADFPTDLVGVLDGLLSIKQMLDQRDSSFAKVTRLSAIELVRRDLAEVYGDLRAAHKEGRSGLETLQWQLLAPIFEIVHRFDLRANLKEPTPKSRIVNNLRRISESGPEGISGVQLAKLRAQFETLFFDPARDSQPPSELADRKLRIFFKLGARSAHHARALNKKDMSQLDMTENLSAEYMADVIYSSPIALFLSRLYGVPTEQSSLLFDEPEAPVISDREIRETVERMEKRLTKSRKSDVVKVMALYPALKARFADDLKDEREANLCASAALMVAQAIDTASAR